MEPWNLDSMRRNVSRTKCETIEKKSWCKSCHKKNTSLKVQQEPPSSTESTSLKKSKLNKGKTASRFATTVRKQAGLRPTGTSHTEPHIEGRKPPDSSESSRSLKTEKRKHDQYRYFRRCKYGTKNRDRTFTIEK